MDIRDKTSIVILAYEDFESLEISLYCHSRVIPKGVDIYILQNGRGTYDSEKTYGVAKRYETLFPTQIKVIDWIKPQPPYLSIKELLKSKIMDKYDYICKMDDDTFPLTSDWFDRLCKCYEESYTKYGDMLGYVTSLINNNAWGFSRVLKFMNIEEEYFSTYAREHYVGSELFKEYDPYRLISSDEISDSGFGTIWRNAYISRWLHSKTTLNHEAYIESVKEKCYEEVNNGSRFSINCILFRKDFWFNIDIGSIDDEHQCAIYCKNRDKKIIACLNIPMVHLFFYSQREENKDLLPIIKEYYEKRFALPFPISMSRNKEYENECRLKYIEDNYLNRVDDICGFINKKSNMLDFLFSIESNYRYTIFTILGMKITVKKKPV